MRALLPLVFLSGVSALIYEVVWVRMLLLVFGVGAYAVAAVLASFLGGLALGSVAGGRLADRSPNPLRMYGRLEASIGASALGVILAVSGAGPLYIALYHGLQAFPLFYGLLFLLSFAILLVPTALMGATLPAVTRALADRPERVGNVAGRLYAFNTLGGVAGVFLAGFVLIENLGIVETVLVAAALNFLVAAAVVFLGKGWRGAGPGPGPGGAGSPPAPPPPSLRDGGAGEPPPAPGSRRVLPVMAASGFAALALEVVWTRILSVVFVNTVYSFSVVLATFLLGIGLGSVWMARRIDRARDSLRLLGQIELAIGILVVALYPLLAWLASMPGLFLENPWATVTALEFAATFAILLPPTFLMGAAFPVAVRARGGALARAGGRVGRLYSANTAGGIAGSIAAVFILIPVLGLQKSVVALGAIHLALGWFLLQDSRASGFPDFSDIGLRRQRLRNHGAPPAKRGVLLRTHRVRSQGEGVMNSLDNKKRPIPKSSILPALVALGVVGAGLAYPGTLYARSADLNAGVLFYREGVASTVAVLQSPSGLRQLRVDGIDVAGEGPGKLGAHFTETQKLQAHIPLLLHGDPRAVAIVGFGSGGTSYSATLHGARVEDAELSAGVLEAAVHFPGANQGILRHPNYTSTVADGRNYLLTTPRRYDVILSESVHPAYYGNSNLYTREFFQLARERLNDGGVFSVWLPLWRMGEGDVKMILRTFADVFPGAALFDSNVETSRRNSVLVGKKDGPVGFDPGTLPGRMGRVAADLREAGVNGSSDLAGLLLLRDNLSLYAGPGPLNTDGHPLLEFSTPRWVDADRWEQIRGSVLAYRDDPSQVFRSFTPRILVSGS